MKVNIGPFISPFICNWHRDYMQWRYGYGWDHGIGDNQHTQTKLETAFEKFEDGINWVLRNTINRIQNKRERKVKIKIHKYDAWCAYHTIALVVHPLLVELKKQKQGTSWVEDEDAPEEFGSKHCPPPRYEGDWDENCGKRWDFVLDEIIWAFDQIAREDEVENQFWTEDYQYDKDGHEAWRKRVNNGMRLFGKYWPCLRD